MVFSIYMSEPVLVLNPPMNIDLVTDSAGLIRLKDFFKKVKTDNNGVLGFDAETNMEKNYFNRKCRLLQFGTREQQFVIDLLAFIKDPIKLAECQGNYGKKICPELREVIEAMTEVLCTDSFLKVGVNLGFEYTLMYWNFGLRIWNLFSCDMVERVICAGEHSLKHYEYYSMDEMFYRYFGYRIDKTLQTSFTLDGELTADQVGYAAKDTRYPLAVRLKQLQILERDNLSKTASIENNAIGSFQDMHIHGEFIDIERWNKRVQSNIEKKKIVLTELDEIFLPLVGSKNVVITDEEVLLSEKKWKCLAVISEEEVSLRGEIKKHKNDPELKAELEARKLSVELARKEEKEILKKKHSSLKKQRTKLNKLIDECEGEALINYDSQAQLLEHLTEMRGLKRLTDTSDDSLEKHKDHPVIQLIRKHRELSKQINTYGFAWTQKWTTHPCKEEGWLHPGDGKLHSVFSQLDAETGRSTSEKPNGQNLPQDTEVRYCFIAGPPEYDSEEEQVIITADMSGAELRIIAEEAQAKTWIEAFERDEDVHSVGTELLYPHEWPKLAVKEPYTVIKDGKEKTIPVCAYYKLHTEESVAKNPKCVIGTPMRLKCDCPEHKKLRDGNKATNFLLAYGGTSFTLAARLGVPRTDAQDLMNTHEKTFPDIWEYLENSGERSFFEGESRDMYGRRRLLPKPTWETATERAKEYREKSLKYSDVICKKSIDNFIKNTGRKPNKEEAWFLTHRMPDNSEIANAYAAMCEGIKRQGKNHRIQGANASIAKLAMGTGFDTNENKPYLWHILPLYNARLLKFVHDELVVKVAKSKAEQVAFEIGDAFRRAGAERMKKVVMKFDFNIAAYWKK